MVSGGRTKRLSRGIRNSLVVTDEEGGFSPEIGSGALREEEEGVPDNIGDGNTDTEERRNDSVEIRNGNEGLMLAGGVEDSDSLEGREIDR